MLIEFMPFDFSPLGNSHDMRMHRPAIESAKQPAIERPLEPTLEPTVHVAEQPAFQPTLE